MHRCGINVIHCKLNLQSPEYLVCTSVKFILDYLANAMIEHRVQEPSAWHKTCKLLAFMCAQNYPCI